MVWTSPMKPRPSRRRRLWLGRRADPWLISGLVIIAISTVSPATAAAGATAPAGYAVTILGTLSPNPNLSAVSNGAGVNDLGWVVGDANYPGPWTDGRNSYPPNTTEHATLWRNGQITDLGTLGGPNGSIGFVARPSDTGLISGNAQNDRVDPNDENWGVNFGCTNDVPCEGQQYEFRGFVWKDGVIRPLPTLGGNNEAAFGGVNDQGQMAGMAETRKPDPTCQPSQFYDSTINQTITLNQVLDWRPVVWGPTYGVAHELPIWPGDKVGLASAINDEGQVAGGSGFCTTPAFGSVEHALLWKNGRTINLGSLGGTYDNLATAINNRGQVVGWSDLPGDTPTNGTTHSFLWQDGIMTDLGTLPDLGTPPDETSTYAYGIDDAGHVVGQSCGQNGCQAFLWQNGTMTDLNTIAHLTTPGSFDLVQAEGINSQGEIVGNAIDNNTGYFLAFSAFPCDSPPATEEGCNDGSRIATTTASSKAVRAAPGLESPRRRMGFASLVELP
jgi:probable HAF family extracellular repeat protein